MTYNPAEFLRLVDHISRERGLDRSTVLDDIERALQQASSKRFDQTGEFTLTIDRETGEIRAFEDDKQMSLEALGRIVANVAKQVITNRLRERERDVVLDEFAKRLHTIISGSIMRIERGTVIVSLGQRTEAILPHEEQIPGEVYRPGAVLRSYVLSVAPKGQRVRIILSRTHAQFVRALFEAEIPEIADGLIEIKGIVREPGRRTKIAVASLDARVDPVGSCVGMRGSRITKIADELGGEKIDIIPWAEDPAQYIINALKPAHILRISYDGFRDRARVVVSQDQLPLAIGKSGQNVRLAARLTHYKIDVMSEEQARDLRQKGAESLQVLIKDGLIEDFLREVFLDLHLDTMAVLAAQPPEALAEALADYRVDMTKAEELVAKADSLLTPEQRLDKDKIVQQRLDAEREEQSRAMIEAERAAVAEAGGTTLAQEPTRGTMPFRS